MSRVRLRIVTGTTRMAFEGRRAFFDRVIAPLLPAPPTAVEASPSRRAEARGPAWTPASPPHFVQFAAQVGARAATPDQRIMAFAFYLWNFEKREECTRSDVESFFRTVQQEPPADLTDRLADLAGVKRFLESTRPDAWRLSPKGVNYVKNRLLALD